MNFIFAVTTTISMTILPILSTESLSISIFLYSIIEGFTELFSNILKLVSGNMYDRLKKRKFLFIIPAIFSLLSKTFLFLPGFWTILSSKIFERLGNGLFATPRDVFIAKNSKNRGLGLGILTFTKSFGCVVGPLLISSLLYFLDSIMDNLIIILNIAVLLNLIALGFSFCISPSMMVNKTSDNKFEFNKVKTSLKVLFPIFLLSTLFFLARFNDGVIILYLKHKEMPEWFYMSSISMFNFIMMITSPLLGYYLDKNKDKLILILVILSLIFFNILFFFIDLNIWFNATLGIIFWGIQRVGSQITFSNLIFKHISKDYYGTAIGIYSVLSGLTCFIASSVCGYIANINFNYMFAFSGFIGLITLVTSIYYIKKI